MDVKKNITSDEFRQGGYFPLEYFVEFIQYLKSNKNIEVITYADLAWGDENEEQNIYEMEKSNWIKQLGSGERDPKKTYVLLQHDVDSRPDRSMRLIQKEIEVGVRSNVMVFARRHNRKELKNNSILQYTDYNLDVELLKRAEKEHGFVIGYHCNAYEQALYDLAIAQLRMVEDIKELEKEYSIKYWSAHGGVPGENGINNNKIVPATVVNQKAIWVHNGATPLFDGNYSDGGLNNKKRDPCKRNLKDFVSKWERGKRYRILTHPQYYSSPPQYNEWLATADWYQNIFNTHSETGAGGWTSPSFFEELRHLKMNRITSLLKYLRGRLQ